MIAFEMPGGGELLVFGILVVIPIAIVTATLLAIRNTRVIADELKKLAELHDQGVLTDDEFAEQKKKLLGHK